jgi:hypothetical protein
MLAAQSSSVSGIVFTVAVLATSLALVGGLAWASRRLLGLPVGALRALIAGLLGFVVAYLLGRSLRAAQPGHAVAFFTVALGVPLVVAMIFIVVAEALVPSGTGPGPVEAIRGVRSALARSRRYWQISRIAVRHGLRPYLRGRRRDQDAPGGRAALALSLRRALEEGGLPSPSWVSCCPPAAICSVSPVPGSGCGWDWRRCRLPSRAAPALQAVPKPGYRRPYPPSRASARPVYGVSARVARWPPGSRGCRRRRVPTAPRRPPR